MHTDFDTEESRHYLNSPIRTTSGSMSRSADRPRAPFDVIVLGAGAAGLAAAAGLRQRGLEIVVLEARSRAGGRILTVHDPAWPVPIELGAEFLHGSAPTTSAVLEEAGIATEEVTAPHLWSERGRLRPVDGLFGRIEEVWKRIPGRGKDRTLAEFLRSSRGPRGRLRLLAAHFVEGYHAADLDRISARSLRPRSNGEGEDDERQRRVRAGYGALVDRLVSGLDRRSGCLRLGTVATQVRWSPHRVVVECRSTATGRPLRPIGARAIVVTLPVGVLRAPPAEAGAVRFSPELRGKKRALAGLLSGHVTKVVLRFRGAFWASSGALWRPGTKAGRGRGALGFVHSRDPAFPTWWTMHPVTTPVLVAWAGGPAARRAAAGGETAMLDRCLATLARMLDVPRSALDDQLEGWSHHDWEHDPFSRGAYSYVAAGALEARDALARPMDGTLFFAGEATDPDETGTVEGAMRSGQRVAEEVERALRGSRRGARSS
jgi:monoamine oxidase